MKALVHVTHGGPEVLRLVEWPDPVPGPLDVVVRVAACATNRLDVTQRAGWFTIPGFRLPHLAGMDLAGEIAGVGAEVDGISVGDRVVVDPSMHGVPDGAAYAGRGDLYGDLGVIGANLPGGYAELCLVPASHVHPLAPETSFDEAASIPTAYATAWHALAETGRLEPAEVVLVHAAGSGVASAVIQLAVRLGATVLASTSGGEAKLAWARQLGAADVCDNQRVDVGAWALERTDGRGVDMVVDLVGPALWEASMQALRPRGRLVYFGNVTGDEVRFSLGFGYSRGLALLGSDAYRPEEFAAMLPVVLGGGFIPLVTERYPLADAAEAHRRLESGTVAGKQILLP
jgi:NADPH:quinone reductase-like Zn-dependent oxidoreductase